ncbi:hypothetical protein ACWCXX_30620 [Streptomyces sp. NPDC001732]
MSAPDRALRFFAAGFLAMFFFAAVFLRGRSSWTVASSPRDSASRAMAMAMAMAANRPTSPAPLVRVGDWARTWAVEKVFGVEPILLNDDRLARVLTDFGSLG